MCRSRRELSNVYLLAKIRLDTAENEPSKVRRIPWSHPQDFVGKPARHTGRPGIPPPRRQEAPLVPPRRPPTSRRTPSSAPRRPRGRESSVKIKWKITAVDGCFQFSNFPSFSRFPTSLKHRREKKLNVRVNENQMFFKENNFHRFQNFRQFSNLFSQI